MRRYFFLSIAVASIILVAPFSICFFLASPIPAEYWVREIVIVKERLANTIFSSPRIILLGGSSTLFSFDAQEVTRETGVPAMNMGLHGGLRLDRVLRVAEDVIRRGDILVLPLEPNFYSCAWLETWNDWQLRNALAWDRSYFENLPLSTRIKAIFSADTRQISIDILASKFGSIVSPKDYAARLNALDPDEIIWARYLSGEFRTKTMAYSAYNLDSQGDMQQTEGAYYTGPAYSPKGPADICPVVLAFLTNFVTKMKSMGVRVIVAHTPYLVEGSPAIGWEQAEDVFLKGIYYTGAEMLDHRDQLFFPRAYFLDTAFHLNDQGRREASKALVANLKKLGIGQQRALAPGSVGN